MRVPISPYQNGAMLSAAMGYLALCCKEEKSRREQCSRAGQAKVSLDKCSMQVGSFTLQTAAKGTSCQSKQHVTAKLGLHTLHERRQSQAR